MEKTEFVLHNINYSEYGIESIEIGYDNHIETFAFFGNESDLNLKIKNIEYCENGFARVIINSVKGQKTV